MHDPDADDRAVTRSEAELLRAEVARLERAVTRIAADVARIVVAAERPWPAVVGPLELAIAMAAVGVLAVVLFGHR